MPNLVEQVRPSSLTPEQLKAKQEKDTLYEQEVKKLSDPFYTKKHGEGVTPEEEVAYKEAKQALWRRYEEWAIANGIFRVITVQEQYDRAVEGLKQLIQQVNELRKELGLEPITLPV